MKDRITTLEDKVTGIDEKVDDVAAGLTKVEIIIERLETEGIDFKVSVRNGGEHPKWISNLVRSVYAQTRAFREYPEDEQYTIMKAMFEFFKFFSMAFRHKLLFIVGILGVALLLKVLFSIVDNVNLLRLLQ